MVKSRLVWYGALLLLAACGAAPVPQAQAAENERVAEAVAEASPRRGAPVLAGRVVVARSSSAPRSCAAEIGVAAATARVKLCRNVSPATRPPCNAANSCALIDDEIARSCALFDGKGPPMAGCTPAPKGMAAAAAVVRRYYAALDARDYGTAWAQWGENGVPGRTLAQFRAGFARTRSTTVAIGTLIPGSGGAGSIYQPVPVTVDATLDDGTRQRFRGEYVVRRVNDVDGSTADQRRWHIGSAELKAVPAR